MYITLRLRLKELFSLIDIVLKMDLILIIQKNIKKKIMFLVIKSINLLFIRFNKNRYGKFIIVNLRKISLN